VSQLKNYKVLELASVLAGPAVGQFFAELGAEVIKVENLRTGGDVTRSWRSAGENTDDRSAYFCAVNWGKRSIAVDLSTAEGKDIVQKLAGRSDIVIASYKPGDAEKLGVDYNTLRRNNPGLIYGQITGYGPHNPRVGYDAIIQAEAGFMFMNGESGGPSLKMPVALIDVLAGHQLKEGLLLAMLEKVQTGNGRLVEVSLLQAAVSSLANQASNWLVANKLPRKQGSLHPNIAPYGEVFKTADGKELLLAVGSDQQFRSLCKLLGVSSLPDAPEYTNNAARVENRATLHVILSHQIAAFSSTDLLPRMHAAKIPAGIIQNMSQVFQMEEVKSLVISARNDSNLKGVRTYVASTFQDNPAVLSPPPRLGEHTDEIIKSLEQEH
jgi:crotonobetainyl-CoA:carnitine CoA-transferase CaiB-like acyl-CoA transferase